MKKIRYSRGIKYIPIGSCIFFECCSLISGRWSIKECIQIPILTLFVSIPFMISLLRNYIKYDNERIYFYKFAFLTKTIEMYDILYLQITEVHKGRGIVSEHLNITTKENKRYKFKISYLKSEDIACMENFIEEQYSDVKILPTNRTSPEEILNDKIKRLHNKFL